MPGAVSVYQPRLPGTWSARAPGATGTQVALRIHPDDAPAHVEAFLGAVRDQTAFTQEVRFRRADGEWRWVSSHAEPRFSPAGEYLGHVGLSPDITERKLATSKPGNSNIPDSRDKRECRQTGYLVVSDDSRSSRTTRNCWRFGGFPARGSTLPGVLRQDQRPLSAALERVKDPDQFWRAWKNFTPPGCQRSLRNRIEGRPHAGTLFQQSAQ